MDNTITLKNWTKSKLQSFEKSIDFEWNMRDLAEILEYHPNCSVVMMSRDGTAFLPRRGLLQYVLETKRRSILKKLMRLSISYVVKLSCDIYRASATITIQAPPWWRAPIHEQSRLFVIKNDFSIYFDAVERLGFINGLLDLYFDINHREYWVEVVSSDDRSDYNRWRAECLFTTEIFPKWSSLFWHKHTRHRWNSFWARLKNGDCVYL